MKAMKTTAHRGRADAPDRRGAQRDLLEPMGRNTASAVTVAALQPANGEDPLLLVLAADRPSAMPPNSARPSTPAASPPKRAAW